MIKTIFRKWDRRENLEIVNGNFLSLLFMKVSKTAVCGKSHVSQPKSPGCYLQKYKFFTKFLCDVQTFTLRLTGLKSLQRNSTDFTSRHCMASNSFIGKTVLAIALSIFAYYTFWVSVLPFLLVEEDNFIHSLFPPLWYAFAVPATFGVLFIGGLSIFTLYKTRKYIKWF